MMWPQWKFGISSDL